MARSFLLCCSFWIPALGAITWQENAGINCYQGHGATDVEPTTGADCGKMSVSACEQKCNELASCTGITMTSGSGDQSCYRRGDIVIAECMHSTNYITYVKVGPSPTPPSPTPPSPTPSGTWEKYAGANCYAGNGATDLEPNQGQSCGTMSLAECEQKCIELPGCTGITIQEGSGSRPCYRRGNIVPAQCVQNQPYDTYIRPGTPPAPPTPPTPTPPTPPSPCPAQPTPGANPLNIQPNPIRSDNFFLIIGDWGAPTDQKWAHSTGGCQRQVAQMMKDYVKKYEAQGKKCLFVGAVGDNFYAAGVKDSAHWWSQWGNVYGANDPSSGLYGIPWLAVLGNHDMGSDDPTCACGGQCKQFNNGDRPAGTEKFWMPDYFWHYYIEGIDLEVIGLDTNALDVGGLGGNGCGGGAKVTCQKCGGQTAIQNFLTGKLNAGYSFIDDRACKTGAKTAVILQHYNAASHISNVGAMLKQRFESNNYGKTHVLAAYGHAHDQQCQGSRQRGCDVILTGGGGGWKGGGYFGFTAVHLTDDGGYQTVLESSEVRIRQSSCSYLEDNITDMEDIEVLV